MDPSAIISCNDSFCTKYHSEAIAICKALESGFELGLVELFGGFCAVAYKYLVGVVMLVVVVTALTVMVMMLVLMVAALTVMVMMLVLVVAALTVMVMMLVVVVTAFTVMVVMLVLMVTALTVMVMVLMLVLMVAPLSVVVMVLMLVLMVTALTVMVMVLMLVLMVATLSVVVMVLMLVLMVTALTVMVMMLMVVVAMRFFLKMLKLGGESRSLFHRLDDLSARKLIPRRRDDHSTRIVLSYKSNAFADFGIGDRFGVAKNDTSRVLYLIVEKFAKILHVHFAFVSIYNGRSTIELCTVCIRIFHSRNNVGKLTHARGLDKDSVGMIFVYNLFESFCKIAD